MKNVIKYSIASATIICSISSALHARDISPKEYEIYAAENFRVDFSKLPKDAQEKVKTEYEGKIKFAQAIVKKTENDPIYNAAREFKTLEVWTRQIASSVKVTDEILKAHYNKQELTIAPKYKLRNILVKTNEDAQRVSKKLSTVDSGKLSSEFISLVKEYSLDKATKDKNGESGWVDDLTMPKEIIEQLKNKPKNSLVILPEIKDVGVQIILIEDIAPEHKASFEEAKQFLTQKMIQQAIETEAKKVLSLSPKTKKN